MNRVFVPICALSLATLSMTLQCAEAEEYEVRAYSMSSLTSDSKKPGCHMTFTDSETVRFPRGGSQSRRSNDVPCIVFRNGEEIGTLGTNSVRNEFTDYDVVPGETYIYEIRGYNRNGFVASTGEKSITCNFIYGIDVDSQVMTFEASDGTKKNMAHSKGISYSLYKRTVDGKTQISGRVSCNCNVDWITVEVTEGAINIGVETNETDAMRVGTVTIEYDGFKCPIKVIQGVSESLLTVTIDNGSEMTIPQSWFLEKCAAILVSNGGDYATAARSKAANNLNVWECYVAGLDPTNANSHFEAKIEMKDGAPVITWLPNLNENGLTRNYTIYGKTSLSDGEAWVSPTNSFHRFFKVGVEIP